MPTPDDNATNDPLNRYLDGIDGAASPAPRTDALNAYLDQLDAMPEPPDPAKPRSWGQAAGDTVRGLASGVGGVVKSAGQLYGLATGDMDNGATALGQSVQDYWEGGQSEALKGKKLARKAAIDGADDVLDKAVTAFWETVSDPALAADALASNIATFIPGAAAGRLAAGAQAARGLAAASKLGPASAATRAAVATQAGTLGTRTAIGVGALQQGADVSGDVYEATLKKPDAVWAANPEFVARLAQTDGSIEARNALKQAFALTAARVTLPAAAAISVAANAIPGADMIERALVGGGARQAAKAGVSLALPKAMAKGGLGEMTGETIEEGGGALAGNVAKQQIVDPAQDLSESVGENAGMGAAGGLLMGVGGGAFNARTPEPLPDPLAPLRAAAQLPNSPLARAATVAAPPPGAPGAPPAPPAPGAPVVPGVPGAPVVPGAALTAEQIEAEIARLDAQGDPIEETSRQIEQSLVQAAADKARQRAADKAAQLADMPEAGLRAMVTNLATATSPEGNPNSPEDNAMGLAAQAELERRRQAARPTITDPINGREVTGDDPRYDMVRAATGMDNLYTGMPPAAPTSGPDPMYKGAVSVVMGSGKASIALVQRELKIGYNRAAKLVEDMERAGLVSAMDPTTGARTVLKPLAEIPNSETEKRDRAAAKEAANAQTGVLEGDQLTPNGTPFVTAGAAKLAQQNAFPGHDVVALPGGGHVLRAKAVVPVNSENVTTSPEPVQKTPESIQVPGSTEEAPAYAPQPENTGTQESPAPGAQAAAQGQPAVAAVSADPAGADAAPVARVWSGDGITPEDRQKATAFLNESGVDVLGSSLTGAHHYKTKDGKFEVRQSPGVANQMRLVEVKEDGVSAPYTFTSLGDAAVYVHDRMQGRAIPAPPSGLDQAAPQAPDKNSATPVPAPAQVGAAPANAPAAPAAGADSFAAQALAIADELERIGGDKDFIGGIRAASNNPRAPLTQANLDFYRQRLDTRKALLGQDGAAVRESNTLERYFTEPDQVKRLAEARAGGYGDLLAQVDARLTRLGEVINQAGMQVDQVDSRVSDRRLLDAKGLMSAIAGNASRLINKDQAVRKDYKRADPAALQAANDDLAQKFAEIDAFLTRDGLRQETAPAQQPQALAATENVAPVAAPSATIPQNPGSAAIERPAGWAKRYDLARPIAEALGISLNDASGARKQRPQLVADIQAHDAAAAAAPAPAATSLETLLAQTRRFASGMSRIGDLGKAGAAVGGLDRGGLGVDVGELSQNGIDTLANAIVNLDAAVFVDSGAFGAFRAGLKSGRFEPMDFEDVQVRYEKIEDAIARANPAEKTDYPRPLFVMPDVVGDQAASLDLIKAHKSWIRAVVQGNLSQAVIPLHKGTLSLAQAYAQIVQMMGSDNFIVGIPSNAKAVTPQELIAFLREAKPRAIHILGAAADSRLLPRLQAVLSSGLTDLKVTADASPVRSAILQAVANGAKRGDAIADALFDQADPAVARDKARSAEAASPAAASDKPAALEITSAYERAKADRREWEVTEQPGTEAEMTAARSVVKPGLFINTHYGSSAPLRVEIVADGTGAPQLQSRLLTRPRQPLGLTNVFLRGGKLYETHPTTESTHAEVPQYARVYVLDQALPINDQGEIVPPLAQPMPASPYTRTNAAPERAAADRLEKLIDTFSADRNTPEGSARAAMRGLIEELRKPRTAVSVIELLDTARQRLARKFPAQAQALEEIAASLESAAALAPALRFNAPNELQRAAEIRAAIDALMDADAQLVAQANPATNARQNFQLVVKDAFEQALVSLVKDMSPLDFSQANARTTLPGYLQRVGDKFIERHYGAQAAPDKAPTGPAKTPIQKLTEPPFLDYRVQQTASNSVKLLPPVGKQFTVEQIQQLKDWVNAAGFTGYTDKGILKVIGDDAPDIPDGLQTKRLAKAAAAEKARDDTKAAAAAASTAEYQALPASQWIESTLGADFANAYNKLQLARYLEGGKFEGLTSSGWFAPLERMGFDTSDGQMPASRVLEFLRQRYQDSRTAAAPRSPQADHLAAQADVAARRAKEAAAQEAAAQAAKDAAAQASDILTAAGLTGKARLDVLAQVKDGTFTPAELLAAYPPLVKSEPTPAPAAMPAPAPAAAPVSAKEKARALRETEVATFAQLVADPAMVGQSVQALSDTLKARLPASKPEQLSKMATELQRQLLKQAAALEKARHRDPAVYQAAVDGARLEAGIENDAETTDRFQAGWAHALAGKTKSTLSGDALAIQVRGYEGAKAWMKTEEGAAWYEGRPSSKLQNTGLDLRRHWELMRAQMKAGESDIQKAWKAIERATNRADLFAPLLPEGVKPGFKLYVTEVRDHLMPFKKWLEDKTNWYGRQQYRSRHSDDTKTNLDYLLDGSRYPGELSPLDRRQYMDDSAYRADWLRARADDYLTRVRQYIGFLDGSVSVKDAAEQFEALFLVPDPDAAKNKHNYYYSTQGLTEAGKSAYSGVFDGTRTDFQKFRAISDWTELLIEREGTIALPKRADPLTPPKLDRVTREGLADRRQGADVTPDEFKRVFGFADIGFGKWVGARQDQDHLNYAYDAFMDLASHFGMAPKNIGFGAQLHFTIGALGHGKFSAHYQRAHPIGGSTVQVINLTNTRGDGTVYHEWVHALDANLGGEWRGVVRNQVLRLLKAKTLDAKEIDDIAQRFLIGGTYWSRDKNMPKVDSALKALRHYTGLSTGMTAYKSNADKLGKDYWGNDEELIARASEAWAADTLGGVNSYLVNGDWVGEGKASPEKGHRGTPYPTGQERILFTQVFQALAKAVKWTDGRPTVTAKDFQAALPADPGEERRKFLLAGDHMQQLHNALVEVVTNEAMARQAAKNDAERAEQQAMDEAAAQLLASMQTPAPAPSAIDPPAPSQAQGELTEDDYSALFDQAAAEVREENQEKPDAPAPGEPAQDDALSEDDYNALFDQAAAEVRAENQPVAEPAPAPASAPAPAPAPSNAWNVEELNELLEKAHDGDFVAISNAGGIPGVLSIGDIGELGSTRHVGMGMFETSGTDASSKRWTLNWDGGGAMNKLTSGKPYTNVAKSGAGVAPWPSGIKRAIEKERDAQAEARRPKPAPKPAPAARTPKAAPAAAPAPVSASAAELLAKAAKLGVTGADEALKALSALFGKPGRLNSFPGGFDEDTYQAAKPHMKKSLESFQQVGKTLLDLFKMLIAQFGDGFKAYAVRFAKDEKLTTQLGAGPGPAADTGADTGPAASASSRVADQVAQRLRMGHAFDWRVLFGWSDAAFGGSQADGKYTPRDAYDAMEMGMNRFLLSQPGGAFNPNASKEDALASIAALERLTALLPTQTKRTAEQDQYQQFSTVPALAFAANWVANVTAEDTLLEPSGGVGGLAVFGKNAGAKLILNELSSRRAALLREVFPGAQVFSENAEQIHNILPLHLAPSVVVMNPPFSASASTGIKKTQVGAQHVDQALSRLVEGGRLVAIVGEGMAMDKPAFKAWWKKVAAQYDVRAVIPMDGAGYAKYGTTYDNVILVIDKVPPTGRPIVTTPAATYNELVGLLSEIRHDRAQAVLPASERDAIERDAAESALGEPVAPGGGEPGGPSLDAGGPAAVDGRAPLSQPAPGGTGGGGRVDGGARRPGGRVPEPGGRPDAAGDDAGRSGAGDGGEPDGASGLTIASGETLAGALTNSVFEAYQPQRLSIPGARPHPGPLVQSAAMASVLPPAATYTPNLPSETITEGKLSIAQLETVVYAGQAHSEFLEKDDKGVEYRRGFFCGDGTGVGKGREIAGILLDNLRRGRTKHVWVSEKQPLIEDAKRDFKGVGGDVALLFPQGTSRGTKAEDAIQAKSGVIFTTYSTLRSGAQSQDQSAGTGAAATQAHLNKAFPKGSEVIIEGRNPFALDKIDAKAGKAMLNDPITGNYMGQVQLSRIKSIAGYEDFQDGDAVRAIGKGTHGKQQAPAGKAKKAGQSRLDQLVAWLGKDFDGVIALDEVHNAGNAVPVKVERGTSTPSAQALAVVELQKRLPKARIVYVSATGATQVANLSYATRLGLWGAGTPFASVFNFIAEMVAGGLATMELVARDMKQMGSYIARSLSFDGVTYSRVEHALTPLQKDIYNRLAEAWQVTLQNFDEALKANGSDDNGEAKGNAKAAYWGAQQRFFNQVITSMQMPTVLDSIERDIANGHAVVLQLVNTNEAQQTRAVDKRKAEGESLDLEDLDLTPRDQLLQMIEKAFPVVQYEDFLDDQGALKSRPVLNADNSPVLNRQSVAARDKLLQDLKDIRVPDGPLELILNHFGADKVAEVTGRTQRVVRKPDATGEIKAQLETRSSSSARADAEAFLDDKKQILIFSDAGGTGYSFHADLTKKNQRKRQHYLLQPGWRADKAIQGLGRSHRSNQRIEPNFLLASTDIPAQKRFLSAIARRLDMLGALTKGQRDTANQGLFNESDNLESKYATQAVAQFINDLQQGAVPGINFMEFLRQTGLEGIVDENTGQIAEKKMPETRLFLNRMLSLTLDMQDRVFAAFIERMEEKIEVAAQRGELDAGMQTIKALSAKIISDDVAYTDPRTGAETRLVQLELTQPTPMYAFPIEANESRPIEWVRNAKSGRVWAKILNGQQTLKDGSVVDRFRLRGTGGTQLKPATDFDARDGLLPYVTLNVAEAQALWEQENAARPATYTEGVHMVVGAVLPIWDRLKTSGVMKVSRTQTTDGQRLLGMVIADKDIGDIRRRLNVTSPASRLTPEQVMARILQGDTAELANGWKLTRSRVSNDLRIELLAGGLSMPSIREITGMGVIGERINWKERYFVPTGQDGVPVLQALFKSKPLIELSNPNKTEGELPAFMRRDAAGSSPWRSELSGRIEAAPMKASAAGGWKSFIQGLTTKGVKPDEIEWSGVREFLDLQPGKVTKEALLAYLDSNGVQVQETMLGQPSEKDILAVKRAGYKIAKLDGVLSIVNQSGQQVWSLPDHIEAIAARLHGSEPKYERYQLPGGENYRELLLALPERPVTVSTEGWTAEKSYRRNGEFLAWLVLDGSGGQVGSSYDATTAEQAIAEAAALGGGTVKDNNFQSGHWRGVPNILAHVRFNERETLNYTPAQIADIEQRILGAMRNPNARASDLGNGAPGLAVAQKAITAQEAAYYAHARGFKNVDTAGAQSKILFIEEIQSDWAQSGKKEGFAAPDIEAQIAALNRQYKANDDRRAALNREAADTTEAEQDRFNALIDARDALAAVNQGISDQINALYDQRGNKNSPPKGPFVGKTDAWVGLALKRMITYAADNGFDRVAFITGTQSAERYDLSKQVSRVEWHSQPVSAKGTSAKAPTDGTLQAWDLSGYEVISERIEASALPDYIGKEAAQALLDAEVSGKTGYGNEIRQLEGLDLKVGGEGMAVFYDRIVPNIARDVLKKLGGGPLGMVSIAQPGQGQTRERAGIRFADTSEALQQPGFDITPALREKVAAGLPLFRLGQTGAGAATPQSRQAVQTVRQQVEAMTANWDNAPEIEVVFDMNDAAIPLRVREHNARQKRRGAKGEPDGFVFGGKVYLLAKNLTTRQLVTETLFHEALGHMGLRGLYGKEMMQVLNQVVLMRRAEVLNKVLEYGLDPTKPEDMRQAAEEVLAELAQSRPELSIVKRAIAAVRNWLRANVPGFAKMAVTDEDIIARYILPARRFVEGSGGPGPKGGQGAPAFSRSAMKSIDANVRRGQESLAKALDEKTTVHRAMFRNGLGWVDFEWGDAKKELLHIIERRQASDGMTNAQALRFIQEELISVIAQGAEVRRNEVKGNIRVVIASDSAQAVLVRTGGGSNAWLLTGFELKPGAEVRGATQSTDTQSLPIRSRQAMGAGSEIVAQNPPEGNSDIRYSRRAASGYTQAAVGKLNEYLTHPGNLSLWDRTVGSQYHLAERSPTFKRVFTAAQNFINDVSYYANEAANMAPSILPRLDTWRDLAKSAVSAKDNLAIGAPILQGTLNWARDEKGKPVLVSELQARYDPLSVQQKAKMLQDRGQVTAAQLKRWKASALPIYDGAVGNRFDAAFLAPGVVWSDAELKTQFALNAGQIGLYREFRAATDKSLDNLAKADLLRFGGKDVESLRDMVMEAADADAAAMLLRDHLIEQAGADPQRAKGLLASADGMVQRGDKVLLLKKRGYAPLSRFGRYAVDVVVDGERQYFSLFESMAESNQMAAQMRAEFGAASVKQSKLAQKEFEQFQGVTPESLELFGNMLGLDSTGADAKDQAFQAYLKLTKTNRSAMKRLIHRKGTDGFSQEIGRVLASFVYSNARQTSAALHMGELGEAVNRVDRNPDGTRNGEGELKDHAIELASYIKKPREEAHALRALLFAQYLGGSIASAMINFTQPFTVSMPYLSQFGGVAKAGAALGRAMADQKEGKVLEPGLHQALVHAQEDGVVSPQAVHELQAQAQGRAALRSGDGTKKGDALATARNAFAKLALGWGKLFGLAEQMNRRSTFIAAYRMAIAHRPVLQAQLAGASGAQQANIERLLAEVRDPQAFALKAVNETQFISNKANKAKFARGPIGATLMTFKSYSTNYLELLHRLTTQGGPEGKQAALLMLAMLLLMAGTSGMPGADDLDDVIDFFAQQLGYNVSSKKAKQEFLQDLFGKAFGGFLENGISGIPGMPLDFASRMSMGNLFPGTGLLLQKRDHTGDLKELLGPVGDLAQRGFTAVGQVLDGEPLKAALTIAPKAVSNAAKAADMAGSGSYNDAKGYKVIDSTPAEAAMKAIGFQPASVARVQEANYLHQRAKDFYSQRVQDINARWAKGIVEKDSGQVDKARRMMASWNSDNPDQLIRPNMAAVLKRVKEMRLSKDERIAQTAPRAMKAQFRKELAEAKAERESQ